MSVLISLHELVSAVVSVHMLVPDCRLRWTVHGIPRVPWEAEGVFDGISEYKLDSEGKIYEHKVTNVQMRDPPFARSPWSIGLNLAQIPRLQGAPQVTTTVFYMPQLGHGAFCCVNPSGVIHGSGLGSGESPWNLSSALVCLTQTAHAYTRHSYI